MDFSKLNGLVPAVIQDDGTNEVLMVGFMNDTALERTRETGYVTFYSRTRSSLWTKGETSGNRLRVRTILTDCDDDTLLIRVVREGKGQVCRAARQAAFLRHVRGDETGITVADVEQAVADAFERLASTLGRQNVHAYLADLPQDVDVISVEPVARKVTRPHRYRNAA